MIVAFVALLVMVWAVAAVLAAERRGVRWVIGGSVAIVVAGAAYYMSVPHDPCDFLYIHGLRTALLICAGWIVLCVAPFLTARADRALWFFVMRVCMRFFFASIAAATLYTGISAAMASVHYLFNVSVEWEWYVRVWIVLAGFVAPVVFMAGIPNVRTMSLPTTNGGPRPVRIFAQYVLVPLLVLYTVILYAYSVKILVTTTWPEGGVAYMVLIFVGVTVMVALLLAVERETRPWVTIFTRVWSAIVLPTLVLLAGAIFLRISEHGWTPDRYMVVAFGLWLAVMALYMLLVRKPDVRLPFVTLGVLLILIVFGPWNMFAISAQSQTERLAALLDAEGIRVNGVIAAPETSRELPLSRTSAIQSRVELLVNIDAADTMLSWFAPDNQPAVTVGGGECDTSLYDRTQRIMESMGILEPWMYYGLDAKTSSTIYYSNVEAAENGAIPVAGYDYYVPYIGTEEAADVNGMPYTVHIAGNTMLRVVNESSQEAADADLESFVRNIVETYVATELLPRDTELVHMHVGAATLACTVRSMTIEDIHTAPRVTSVAFSCLMR